MPFERSKASEITGEKDVFSCTRSISLAIWRRPLWMTARVTGSSAMDILSGGLGADGDDDIAEPVDGGGGARIDQDRGVELGHDRRSLDCGADRQAVATENRRVEPAAGEIDRASALPRVFDAAARLGRKDREIDARPAPDARGAQVGE